MKKNEKAGSLIPTLFPMLLFLLSTVSCTPLLIGQAAYQGAVVTTVATTSALTEEENKKLKDSVRAFNDAFRSQGYKQASVFVTPDKKEKFWSEVDRFGWNIRLADYEFRDLQFDAKTKQATVILNFQYWRMENPAVQTVSLTQKWQYFEKGKKWMVSEFGFEAIPSNRQ